MRPSQGPHKPSCKVRKFTLTDEGDLILDPFAGSNTTGAVAEQSGRRWLAFETEQEYLEASKFRFDSLGGHFESAERGTPRKIEHGSKQFVLFDPTEDRD